MSSPSTTRGHWPSLFVFAGLVLAVSLIAQAATATSVGSWYPTLAKPPGTPPGWVIGSVWTVLYALIAVAGWLVWRAGQGRAARAHQLYALQLGLNALWSILFFGLRSPLAGLIEIVLLWLAVAAAIVAFLPWSRIAGWLLVPYLAWVTYATYLNAGLAMLNRSA